MTRPIERNGFGLTLDEADREVKVIESGMTLLAESQKVYEEWRRLLIHHKVLGVQVHDARLAAVMNVNGITHILTLNPSDFARFSGVNVLHPADV